MSTNIISSTSILAVKNKQLSIFLKEQKEIRNEDNRNL